MTLTGFTRSQTSFHALAGRRPILAHRPEQQVTANGQQLDGNGDSTPDDDFVYADSGTATGNQLYRLLGDGNGDRAVNGLDITPFVNQFGSVGVGLAFDFNGDGAVNGLDISPFVQLSSARRFDSRWRTTRACPDCGSAALARCAPCV